MEAPSAGAVAPNVPHQNPPRDMQLSAPPPAVPEEHGVITLVRTTREAPNPRDPEGECRFATDVANVARGAPDPLDPARPRPEAWPVADEIRPSRMARSVFVDALGAGAGVVRVAESCRFSPAEQQRLIALRRQLGACEVELRSLCELVGGDSLESGLPLLREAHRNRYRGSTFSAEDARRELHDERLLRHLQGYTAFIDKALADELDGAQPLAPRGAHVAALSGKQALPASGSRKTGVAISPSPTPTFKPFGC